jgi:hypothetical protein
VQQEKNKNLIKIACAPPPDVATVAPTRAFRRTGFLASLINRGIARLLAILSPQPNRAPSNQIAHPNAVGVAVADRNLVDADGLGFWPARADKLCAQVLLLQRLDRIPIDVELLGN